MSVLLCSNMLSGRTGLDKAVVMTANALHRDGYDVTVLNMLGAGDGSGTVLPCWPFDAGVEVLSLKTLPADGGRHLAHGYHAVLSGSLGAISYAFTANELAALRQLNALMGPEDTIVFTHPIQAVAFQAGLGGERRRPATVLQIHGDYRTSAADLWELTLRARSVIDRIQTVADGMRPHFVPTFAEEDVVWIPNIHETAPVAHRPHDGVEVAVIGSFQERKNQLDAVRALARVPDPAVRMTLWGADGNAYGRTVRDLVASLGLTDRVRIPGLGSENEIYGSADIVLMPSLSEGFPYVLTEATCAGLPIVAYDFDFGPRDAVVEGESGHVVGIGDVEGLADRLARLGADRALRERFGRRSRQVYEERLSTPWILAQYRRLLGVPGGRTLGLAAAFSTDGEPFPVSAVMHRTVRLGGRGVHLAAVRTPVRLHDLEVDDGERCRRPVTMRLPGLLVLAFGTGGRQVVSYATAPGSPDRRYLASTSSRDELEVLPYLRRDADYPVVDAVVAPTRKSPQRRQIGRHPRFPVTSGEDSFGAGLNEPGAVRIVNDGSPLRPTVSISGEHDWVLLRDARSSRRIGPPYGYAELFERVCAAEREAGLLDITTREGVHAWELYRAAFISQLCESFGMWGKHFTAPTAVRDVYAGRKLLSTAPSARRVLFEFPRRPAGVDRRTRAFVDEDTLVISYPQADGYSDEVELSDRVLPIYEYNLWRRSSRRPSARAVDVRPFEDALSRAMGVQVVLGDELQRRVQKFLEEREFWTPVFERIGPEEVVIPSSYWSAGICAAAERAGASTSDIQYALTGRLHPSYWFGEVPRHGARRLYAWSPFWTGRTNGYATSAVVPRWMPELSDAEQEPQPEPAWDVCVVSQPRVSRRVVRFVTELVQQRPRDRVVVAPHPDERHVLAERLARAGVLDRVSLAPAGTFDAIRRSRICVGGYSTSLFEAAAIGRPTYVLPVPGHELMLDDVASGLFRLVTSPADLVPYEVPASRHAIFGTAADALAPVR